MPLLQSYEQDSLAEALSSSLVDVAGDEGAVWKVLADELGVVNIGVPEELGGADGSLADLSVVFAELGRTLAVDELLGHVWACQLLLGLGPQGRELLSSSLAAGHRLTVAGRGRALVGVQAETDGDGVLLTGEIMGVLAGVGADLLVVPVADGAGGQLYAIHPGSGLTAVALNALDQRRPEATVSLRAARAVPIGPAGAADAALAAVAPAVTLMLAAEQSGGASRCLEDAVEYARTRYQFGRAIGSFQAIKHQLADVLQQTHSSMIAVRHAADALENGADDPTLVAGMLRVYVAETYVQAAHRNLQIHGGLGFTIELDCHLHVRRARAAAALFGSPDEHRRRLAAALVGKEN